SGDMLATPARLDKRVEPVLRLRCMALIVVVGPEWWFRVDRFGGLSLREPNDWLRQAIRTALERAVTVVPVLLPGAQLPTPDELPADIREFAMREALTIRSAPDFERDVHHLIGTVSRALEKPSPRPGPPKPEVRVRELPGPIFISYRRSDAGEVAARLRDE